MSKNKLSITIDTELSVEIQKYARQKKLSTSKLIENVLLQWKKENIKKQMIEGYKIMAEENATIAENFNIAGNEAWPND